MTTQAMVYLTAVHMGPILLSLRPSLAWEEEKEEKGGGGGKGVWKWLKLVVVVVMVRDLLQLELKGVFYFLGLYRLSLLLLLLLLLPLLPHLVVEDSEREDGDTHHSDDDIHDLPVKVHVQTP